jgi:hypothetical protein
MSALDDLRSATQGILENVQISEKDNVTSADGPVDLDRCALLVRGNCGPGSVIRGRGDVVIQGAIEGVEGSPCCIEVVGDVVVLGVVAHAQIDARTVRFGASAKNVHITTRQILVVNGDLADAKLNLGGYDYTQWDIDFLQSRLSDALLDCDAAERQVSVDEKRLDKVFRNTRIVLASNVGQILQSKDNRIVVNLEPIYKTLAGRSDSEVDKALQEFFAKAIVGLLTRANREFLVGQNTHRQEIFKGIIRDVHKLFFTKRGFDKLMAKAMEIEESIRERVVNSNGKSGLLQITGRLIPEVNMGFTVTKSSLVEGEAILGGDLARMRLQHGRDSTHVQAVRINTAGEDQVLRAEIEEMQNCQVHVVDGEVTWEPLIEDALAMV